MERLQKIISNSGIASRRKAEELIKEGRVKVDGVVVTELGTKVSKKNIVEVDNVKIGTEEKVYYLLNKPRAVVTTTSDEHGRKTVVDLIATDKRIYPIGRLDYDTTGIILLTNDGNLANKLMHPSSNVEKKYLAKVEGLVTGYDIKRLREGVIVDGRKTAKARVNLKKYDKKTDKSLVELTIHEGRNHQVKKMFEAINHDVLKLKREKYANLDLTGVKPGEYRRLTNKEIAVLYSLVK